VASNVGGIPEFIEDGVNGFLVAAGDADALFDRIEHILIDEAMRASMAAANRDKAAKYDAATMADAYVGIYQRLLEERLLRRV
jgi:glycosyltransferase involved in cell wall biosynthesis